MAGAGARDYLQQRHGISADLFPHIIWKALRYALKKLSPHRRATAVKAIHHHLPTQAKLFQQGRVAMSSLCPRCLKEDETNQHIYCCSGDEALKQRKDDWRELWSHLHKCRTATVIEQVWRYYLQPKLGILLGESIVDGLVIAQGGSGSSPRECRTGTDRDWLGEAAARHGVYSMEIYSGAY